LSELLHASLRDDGREEITVEEEVELAERYLALQRMRFGDRLQYDWHVDAGVADCLVPVLVLQPIVENAVVHSLDAGQQSLHVHIRAVARERDVEITVENDGIAGAADTPRAGHGVGLSTTRARLMTAHGDRASLTLRRPDDGGAVVRIVLPRRVAAPRRDFALHEVTV
jgi:two-component system sensor histidine kinase AlgZ